MLHGTANRRRQRTWKSLGNQREREGEKVKERVVLHRGSLNVTQRESSGASRPPTPPVERAACARIACVQPIARLFHVAMKKSESASHMKPLHVREERTPCERERVREREGEKERVREGEREGEREREREREGGRER